MLFTFFYVAELKAKLVSNVSSNSTVSGWLQVSHLGLWAGVNRPQVPNKTATLACQLMHYSFGHAEYAPFRVELPANPPLWVNVICNNDSISLSSCSIDAVLNEDFFYYPAYVMCYLTGKNIHASLY